MPEYGCFLGWKWFIGMKMKTIVSDCRLCFREFVRFQPKQKWKGLRKNIQHWFCHGVCDSEEASAGSVLA